MRPSNMEQEKIPESCFARDGPCEGPIRRLITVTIRRSAPARSPTVTETHDRAPAASARRAASPRGRRRLHVHAGYVEGRTRTLGRSAR
jgi:hypothetical protein